MTAPPPGGLTHRDIQGLALGFTGVVIFGATLPMTRLAVAELHPWFVTFGRAAFAGILAGALLILWRKAPPPRGEWPLFLLAAGALTVGFPGFMALAMVTLTAAHGGVVLGLLPLATAVAAALMMGERPSIAFWLFGALGSGLVIAFTLREAGGLSIGAGDIFLVLAAASAALGYTASAMLTRTRSGVEVAFWMLVTALPLSVPGALLFLPAAPMAVSGTVWAAFLYLALFSQLIGFFFWNAGLMMGGVARVSQTQLLQTFVTLVVAALVLGEPIGADTWIFAALVVATVVVGLRFRAR